MASAILSTMLRAQHSKDNSNDVGWDVFFLFWLLMLPIKAPNNQYFKMMGSVRCNDYERRYN